MNEGDAVNDQCYWPIGHRNAKDHHCSCRCCLPNGHHGKHYCAYERRNDVHPDADLTEGSNP